VVDFVEEQGARVIPGSSGWSKVTVIAPGV
jgi:hypothetical protein